MRCTVFLLCLLAVTTQAAERWEMQYFHDENKSTLVLNDIKFCSAQRGVAVGQLIENRKKLRPVALVTNDGGAKWSFVETKEPGTSLFFLDETAGWMVTPGGIWFTDEAGRTWRRIRKDNGLERVYFLTREHGFAIGDRKRILETKDAGKTWTSVDAAQKVQSSEEHTTFHAITFATPKVGFIAGHSDVRRKDAEEEPWLQTRAQREWPSLSVFLETRSGGETWTPSTVSMFGYFSELQLTPEGVGLGLLSFDYAFEYPSELYRVDLRRGGKTVSTFRRKDTAVTDIAVERQTGTGFAVGFEPGGVLARTPVPGKLRVLRSPDLTNWQNMEVDYRAIATQASISVWDAGHAWIATDTGMILRLTRD